jgi:uncharacterized protein YfaS (alpha-2-macroglobulin family)
VRVVARPATPRNGADTLTTTTDKEGNFLLPRLPAGAYELETSATVYENKPQPATVNEGQTASAELKLKPNDPFLEVNIHQHAYLPGERPRLGLHGFRQGSDVKVRLLAVDDETLLRDYGSELRTLLSPTSSKAKPKTFRALKSGKLRSLKEWSHPVRQVNAEGVFYDFEHLGPLPNGIYVLQATGGKTEATNWLLVTDLALVTKSANGDVRAYATHLRTGQPVRGAKLTLFAGKNAVANAVSGADGMARLRTAPSDEQMEVIAKLGKSVAFTHMYGGAGTARRYRLTTYTDRPVYRPGHRVRFKGVARQVRGAGYVVPSARSAEVEVVDDQDSILFRDTLTLNERGSFADEFQVPAEARTGAYSIKVKLDGEEFQDDFSVAAYRKPEWRVDVKTPKPRYVRGDLVPVTINAEYYYGQPVAGAQVDYTVYRSPYWSWWAEDEEETLAFEDGEEGFGDRSGEVVAEGKATTNADGTASFEFPTDVDATPATESSATESESGEFEYNIEVNVSDASNRAASGTGNVRVSAGELSLDARAETYMAAPGETVKIAARARDFANNPVPNLPITATALLEIWDGKAERQRQLSTQTLSTGPDGKVELPVTLAESGLVTVRLEAKDRRGNRITASTNVWASSADGGDYPARYPSLSVMLDKKLYRIGDTVQALINTDRPGAVALVAVEGDGIFDLRQVPLKRKSTVVRFPVRAGYEPNVFVSACFVKDREFATSQTRLNVNAEPHRLKVDITSDKETYHPGDTATYQIRTADGAGKPVPAEVSFGVVDEAVYAIRSARKNILWNAFYPRRENAVQTQFSFPEIYLGDADKANANLAVRRNFPDTAFWDPFLRTDSSGRATVRVKLPDSLTSWRATAVAATAGTQVGEATQNLQVMRELTLRLQTPRSLTEGDRLAVTAVAHNYSDKPLDVSIVLKATGLQVQGELNRTVRLEPGAAAPVAWDAVAETTGKAMVTATATGGGFSDGMELEVPVQPFARDTVQQHTGALTAESATQEFTADPNAVSGEVEIRLSPTLAGTVLSALDYLATYPYGCTEQTMSSFLPNVVVMQTLSRLGLDRPQLAQKLPAMTQAGLFRLYRYQKPEGGWGWWEYDEADPWMTAYVLFGLTEAREAGVEVNQRVYESALAAAETLADDKELDLNHAQFLAYALARSKKFDKLPQLLKRVATNSPKLQVRSLGYAALALAATGRPADESQAHEIMRRLWARAEQTDGQTHWTEPDPPKDYYPHGVPTDVETSAVVLKAAIALSPEDPRLSEVARWLLLRRQGNRWESTRDTAWILLALTDYLRSTEELRPEYTATVVLNGRQLHQSEMRRQDALTEEAVLRVPVRGLPEQNRLEVRKAGDGVLYYSVTVKQAVHAETFAAESARPGLEVKREYFRMGSRRDANGQIVVEPEARTTDRFRLGDRVMVRLTVKSDRPLNHIMLEDPLPSGFEVQDRGDVSADEWGYWWSHMDIRDDKVSLFARRIEKGEQKLEYYLRPEMTGTVRSLPLTLEDMYVPSTRASTGEGKLEVTK